MLDNDSTPRLAAPSALSGPARRQRGFTLTELLIVVAIIGVLSAIAVPKYQDYVGRAQAAEALTATAGLRSELALYYAEHGNFNKVSSKDSFVKQSADGITGRYISGVTGLTPAGGNTQVQYTVNFGSGVLSGKSITIASLASNGQIRGWQCRGGDGGGRVEEKYRPAACRDAE